MLRKVLRKLKERWSSKLKMLNSTQRILTVECTVVRCPTSNLICLPRITKSCSMCSLLPVTVCLTLHMVFLASLKVERLITLVRTLVHKDFLSKTSLDSSNLVSLQKVKCKVQLVIMSPLMISKRLQVRKVLRLLLPLLLIVCKMP
jgi:hypothetical protein